VRNTFFFAFLLFWLSAFAIAQDTPLKNPLETTENKTVRVNLYYHLGSIEVPVGYSGYVKADWNDAWAGYVQLPENGLKIEWRAGLIVRVSDKDKNKFVWTAGLELPNLATKIGIKKGKENTIVATIGDLEFSANVKDENEEHLFLEIINTYQKERCTTCRSLQISVR
jgi:hypothetical protein